MSDHPTREQVQIMVDLSRKLRDDVRKNFMRTVDLAGPESGSRPSVKGQP